MRASPADSVDRNAGRGTLSVGVGRERQKDVLGSFGSSHDEIHLLLLGAILAVVHENHARERTLVLRANEERNQQRRSQNDTIEARTYLPLQNDIERKVNSRNDVDPLFLVLNHASPLPTRSQLIHNRLEPLPPLELPDRDERRLAQDATRSVPYGEGDDREASARTDGLEDEVERGFDDAELERRGS